MIRAGCRSDNRLQQHKEQNVEQDNMLHTHQEQNVEQTTGYTRTKSRLKSKQQQVTYTIRALCRANNRLHTY